MKMRLPKLTLFKKRKGKKMRATVARRPMRAATASYDEMAEPNMKLSRALLIVLLLHVVAVSGIIAFNAIKTRESSFAPAAPTNPVNNFAKAAAAPDRPDVAKPRAALSQKEIAPRNDPKPLRSASKDEHAKTPPPPSGKTYIVKKGDNPVTIAKRLKISYDDLLALNHIEDPHKLQIGQKLLIPVKASKTKTSK